MTDSADNHANKVKLTATQKSFIKFITVTILIISFALIYHFTDDKEPLAQKFFENRKTPQTYSEYKETESAKKKAERNIFLQD